MGLQDVRFGVTMITFCVSCSRFLFSQFFLRPFSLKCFLSTGGGIPPAPSCIQLWLHELARRLQATLCPNNHNRQLNSQCEQSLALQANLKSFRVLTIVCSNDKHCNLNEFFVLLMTGSLSCSTKTLVFRFFK